MKPMGLRHWLSTYLSFGHLGSIVVVKTKDLWDCPSFKELNYIHIIIKIPNQKTVLSYGFAVFLLLQSGLRY